MIHKVGMIGCGGIAQAHLSGYKQLTDRIDVIAVADPRKQARQNAQQKWGIPIVYNDYKELLENPEVEIVDICTPGDFHTPPSIDACNAGKHALCEKPLCQTIEEAESILKAVKANGVKFMVAHCIRWAPVGIAVKKLLENKAIGEPLLLHTDMFSWSYPNYGWRKNLERFMVIEMTIHSIDLFHYWLEKHPKRVFAVTGRSPSQPELRGENMTLITLDYDGCYGQINYCWYSRGKGVGRVFRVEGADGTIEGDFSGRPGSLHLSRDDAKYVEQELPKVQGGRYGMNMIKLIEAIETDTEPPARVSFLQSASGGSMYRVVSFSRVEQQKTLKASC